MTPTPIRAATPPCQSRRAAVIAIAMTVGIVPKKSPETARRIERVSKMTCGSSPRTRA
jgi:hypothetical protein